jgi:Na+-transporting NADH:ubiquinone oxidoreductase subunit F
VTTVILVTAILGAIALALLLAERFLVSQAERSVTVNDSKVIKVDGSETLLSVLNRNKLFVPSACGGKATCGLCKVEVPSGGGALLPTEAIFVTKAERERHVRLACQVKVNGSVAVRVPESMLSAREIWARTTLVERLTHDTKLVRFELENGAEIDFKAGQYVQIAVPGTDQFRAYSIASPPSEHRAVELIVRHVPGGLCTGWVHKALAVGDRVLLTGPFGDFFLREDSDREIVAIGGGSGMAPMRSIILRLAELGMPRKTTLFFGARSLRDLFYVDVFNDIAARFPNFRYVPALSEPRPADNWSGEVGFVTQVAQRHVAPDGRKEAVLCGPPPMIDAAMRVLPKLGIPEEHIYFDKF